MAQTHIGIKMTYDVFRHFLSDTVSHRSAMRHVPLERCCMSLKYNQYCGMKQRHLMDHAFDGCFNGPDT